MIVKHGTHTNKSMGPRLYNLLSYNEVWKVMICDLNSFDSFCLAYKQALHFEWQAKWESSQWSRKELRKEELSLKGFHLHYGKYIQMAENFPSLSLVPSFVGHSFNYLKRHPLVKNLLANWLRNTKNGCYFWLKICSTY